MTTILTDNRYYFAQAYGEGSYSSGTYNCNTNNTTSCTASSGSLTNTGTMVLFVVSVACLIIFIALVVRFWRRPKRAAKSLDSAEQSVLQSKHKNKNK